MRSRSLNLTPYNIRGTPQCQNITEYKNQRLTVDDRVLKSKAIHGP